jgi:hypothetical protein
MVRERRAIRLETEESKLQFLMYAIEWATRDLYWATDSPFSQELQLDDVLRVREVTNRLKLHDSTTRRLPGNIPAGVRGTLSHL